MIGYQGLTLLEQSMLYQARLASLLPDRFNLGVLVRQKHPAQMQEQFLDIKGKTVSLSLSQETSKSKRTGLQMDQCGGGEWQKHSLLDGQLEPLWEIKLVLKPPLFYSRYKTKLNDL